MVTQFLVVFLLIVAGQAFGHYCRTPSACAHWRCFDQCIDGCLGSAIVCITTCKDQCGIGAFENCALNCVDSLRSDSVHGMKYLIIVIIIIVVVVKFKFQSCEQVPYRIINFYDLTMFFCYRCSPREEVLDCLLQEVH